jgi:hemoglobin-like flavoprotein
MTDTDTDTGYPTDAHTVPDEQPQPRQSHRTPCPTCRGRGVVPTVADLLQESIALVQDGDLVVRAFYASLVERAPHLVPLFPADLITATAGEEGSPGAHQRERLLAAIVALATHYDDTDPEAMAYINRAARTFGEHHALFFRGEGVPAQGATPDEYALVKVVLFDTLHRAAGAAWLPEYDAAWSQAYDDLQIEMQHAAKALRERAARGEVVLQPRYPRQANREVRAVGRYGPDDPGSDDRD